MSRPIRIEYSHLLGELSVERIKAWEEHAHCADEALRKGRGEGAEFTGWLKPAQIASRAIVADVAAAAERLGDRADTLVVIGIGGSYLGARAAIEALGGRPDREIHFAGHCLSGAYLEGLLTRLKSRNWAINVISKSGTTTEPAISFRILYNALVTRFGRREADARVVATTDARKGALRAMAGAGGWKSFVIPDDVGGRFSVLTPVGLFPIAFAGIDVGKLVGGAVECGRGLAEKDIFKNPAAFYAVARNQLFLRGKTIELLSNFDPRLHYVAEWWKQLYGESEGKDRTGIFPAAADMTTDLHSMGQYIQEGRRELFETFVIEDAPSGGVKVPVASDDRDGLNYLKGMRVDEVNRLAYRGTAMAHRLGGVPNMTIIVRKIDAHGIGALFYFFERACGISGYLLGVNPFNQPGVEEYKTKMFALLGKPGYAAAGKATLAEMKKMGVGRNLV